MTVAQDVGQNLPYLRRYARALTGSQYHGDAFVRATLEAVVAEPELLNHAPSPRVGLYQVFHSIWDTAHIETEQDLGEASTVEQTVRQRLALVTPVSRQALLLTTLEGFGPADAGLIMSLKADDVHRLADEAIKEIERETTTDVLIIEDEPLISFQLQTLVTSLGHTVCGTATTRDEALECVAKKRPGLVLADIQLADGSSGIDAAKDILADIDIPVIFITAFPERLLTGERPEPTFLITKPFLENTVKAAISQAMFLNSTALPMLV
ncbi:MAG: response regulator [Novosphingobium sp.]